MTDGRRRAAPGTEAEIVIVDDAVAGAAEAARRLAGSLSVAAVARGRADFATTGGSVAPGLYRAFLGAGIRDLLPWDRLHIWWGDDRFVARGTPDSNVTPLDDVLLHGDAAAGLAPATLAPDHVHPVPVAAALAGGGGAEAAAAAYAAEIGAAVALVEGVPAFDAIVVGVGPDGHLLSVFPYSAAFDADPAVIALAIPAPTHVGPHIPRVTLHPAVLGAAGSLLVVAFGAGKAAIVRRLLADEGDPRVLPARLARRAGATWILDRAAAAALRMED